MRGDKPVVKLDGQTRGFTWAHFEPLGDAPGEKKPAPPAAGAAAAGKLAAGDKVRVRDSEKEDWKTGTVIEMRGDKPVVKLDGQTRGFTWAHFEPLGDAPGEKKPAPPAAGAAAAGKLAAGDKVRVRDSEKEDWKAGTITEMRGDKPVVKLEGQTRGFTWTFIEPAPGGSDDKGKADAKSAAPSSQGKIAAGDKVRVRDNEKEDWKMGTVTEMRGDKAVVKLEGQSRGFTWLFVEPAGNRSHRVAGHQACRAAPQHPRRDGDHNAQQVPPPRGDHLRAGDEPP
eukprot:TRINITY_DN2087_c0_g3_i1.p1 TRINITY_DN2087_c0_g3~~TRINITY_DN2087_c0_g3_i1.p1  ORF type:complete len:296 (+),score=59.68 TRINITY_DN2087_c0_g3_i1:40-888(+)